MGVKHSMFSRHTAQTEECLKCFNELSNLHKVYGINNTEMTPMHKVGGKRKSRYRNKTRNTRRR